MKYFLMEGDKRIVYSPKIRGWHEKLDIRDISLEGAYKIPKRELMFIEDNPNTIFTDIISNPFYLVSDKVKKTIRMYEPNIILKEVILLDPIFEKTERYFLPIFEEVECLAEESVFNLNHSMIKKIILDKSKVEDRSIFRIANVSKHYVVGNLDIVESILKRGCLGLQLTEIEVKE